MKSQINREQKVFINLINAKIGELKKMQKKEEIMDLKEYRGNKTIYHNSVKWLHLLLKME